MEVRAIPSFSYKTEDVKGGDFRRLFKLGFQYTQQLSPKSKGRQSAYQHSHIFPKKETELPSLKMPTAYIYSSQKKHKNNKKLACETDFTHIHKQKLIVSKQLSFRNVIYEHSVTGPPAPITTIK